MKEGAVEDCSFCPDAIRLKQAEILNGVKEPNIAFGATQLWNDPPLDSTELVPESSDISAELAA